MRIHLTENKFSLSVVLGRSTAQGEIVYIDCNSTEQQLSTCFY